MKVIEACISQVSHWLCACLLDEIFAILVTPVNFNFILDLYGTCDAFLKIQQ